MTITPEAFNKMGKESINLLERFSWNDGSVRGEVEAEKIRDVIKQAMDPVQSFFRAGVVVTCALFFASRVVFFLPVVPTLLLVLSIISAAITWDVNSALRETNHAYSSFNKMCIVALSGREKGVAKVDFDQFVGIIDCYSQQILSNTWFLGGSQAMETSLTSWKEHLTEQVKNQGGEQGESPWNIAGRHLPILPIICRVEAAAR